MPDLMIFAPLQKADAKLKRVWGLMTAETPDRSGEIMDYATGKPAIQKWSESFVDATGGKSLGNVRMMHGKNVVGKVVELFFDDLAKTVSVCAEIVDDVCWSMIEKGILTGFSIGGGYARKWADGLYKRYTPDLNELSVVDRPCLGGATFSMMKVDGTTEDVLMKGFEPGSDATKAYADKLALDAGKPDRRNDYVEQARADLIKMHVETGEIFAKGDDDAWSLQKVAGEAAPAEELPAVAEPALEKVDEPIVEAVDPAAAVADALAKASAAGEVAAVEAISFDFENLSDLGKAVLGIATGAAAKDPLYKGLYNVQWLAELMDRFGSLQSCLSREAKSEGDGSPAPQKAADILASIGELLVSVAKEEVGEAIASMNETGGVEVIIEDSGIMELASKTMALVKCDAPLMEKVGKRNSARDATRIQTIHDHACDLGADCQADVEKLSKSEDEVTRLRKALEDAVPAIEQLGAKVATQATDLAKWQTDNADLRVRLEVLEKSPAAPKGVLRAVSKEDDDGGRKPTPKANDPEPGSIHEDLAKIADPRERGEYLLKHAIPVPGQGPRS